MDKVTSYRTGHRAGMSDGEYDSAHVGATVKNCEKHEVELGGENRTDAYLNGYRDGYQLWIR